MTDLSDESFDTISDSDIDLGLISDDVNPSSTSNQSFEYQVLSVKDVQKQMEETIENIKHVIQLSSAIIRTLLKHFRWDSQKLLERIFDGNEEQLFKDVGIVVNKDLSHESHNKRRRMDQKMRISCEICCDLVSKNYLFGLNCGHDYCKECWRKYLTTKIMAEGDVTAITCAETECKVIVDDEDVLQLISDDNLLKSKYQRLTINCYVESNGLLRWCPKPDCLHVFSVHFREAHPVTCICGTEICFACGQSNHEPITCELIYRWNKKSAGNNAEKIDGRTANWIITNTKECPKCRTSIEKNGGCNHMTCRSLKCKFEFCWVCLQSWATHGTSYYNCNQFNDSKARTVKENQSDQRKSLERFMFYWQRFMNHKQSLKFESELMATVRTRMTQMQHNFNNAWVEVQFMEKAVHALCNCRQTLMYTYVFAFYNERTPQIQIFEINQRDLQSSVETLSELLEREIPSDDRQENKDMKQLKDQVIHSTNYCNKRRKALIDHIIEGYEKDWWLFSSD
ncbi:E3 ubiquitin-protein ligase ARIH1-like [Oppia nitens]|uniref:E3 ubiquitin-protein ligase ARIH1-like n=1 Tax=Oppia nitens TaxID=1686743 RepID=UPI0023DBAAC8|nr:E3 ubiquitin-protein ligase ARIH1-like [Oppia nitens]